MLRNCCPEPLQIGSFSRPLSSNMLFWPFHIRVLTLLSHEHIPGWWYTYPSEKYESQLGVLFPIYGKNTCSKSHHHCRWVQLAIKKSIPNHPGNGMQHVSMIFLPKVGFFPCITTNVYSDDSLFAMATKTKLSICFLMWLNDNKFTKLKMSVIQPVMISESMIH